jgi:hypothetical protein
MSYNYKGTTTKALYTFDQPLLDAFGHPVVGGQYSIANYNGETVVYANRDGSVARGTAGPGIQVPSSQKGIGTNTLPTNSPSAWEQN